MARPTDQGSFADALYEHLDPLTYSEEATDYALLKYLGAIGQMLQNLDYLAHAGADGTLWQNLVDLDAVPDVGIPWLGQFSGVRVNTALTAAQQRQQIRDRLGWGRGTIAAFLASSRDLLTGTQTVVLSERTASAYTFTVNTYADETPDSAAVLVRLKENKPAGLVMTYTVLPGSPAPVTFQQMYDNPNDFTFQNIYDNYQTFNDIR